MWRPGKADMANLFKRPRSPFWWVSYTTATSRVRVSTGIRHEGRKQPSAPALEVRRTIEERLSRAKFGAAPMIEPRPVADYLAAYLATLHDVRQSTLKRYQFVASSFIRWASAEQIASVGDVTYPVASRYVAHRRASGIGAATLRGEVRFFNAAWIEARKLHHCEFDENPWTFTFKVERHEPDPFTDAELAAILAQPMPVWLRLAVDISRYTGARISSIKGLRWEDVTPEAIRFRTSKTTAFTVPVHPRLLAILNPMPASGPVLPETVLAKTDGYISQMFKVVCQRAGVPRGHFHLFRHTFVSRLALAGVEQRVTQLLANHKSDDVHRHYTHSNAAALAPHLQRLTYPECANGVTDQLVTVSD